MIQVNGNWLINIPKDLKIAEATLKTRQLYKRSYQKTETIDEMNNRIVALESGRKRKRQSRGLELEEGASQTGDSGPALLSHEEVGVGDDHL